jgi:peroxiredoxin
MNEDKEITIGRPAPEFALETADDGVVSLAGLRGRLVVLFFVREFT